jgi:hypothetical protein
LNKSKENVKEALHPATLLQISCQVINSHEGLTNQAIRCVPTHLAADLLGAAILRAQPNAISTIILMSMNNLKKYYRYKYLKQK